ncbi:CCAAT/enhancer-binding protein zeta-like [Littorina saxatilis]|uniref:CCAAT-binding factor domain-containing protein n=1 Tax=Littorina saxatilis TaxID=31220 RepID=A0AAN9BHC1_9CAEN
MANKLEQKAARGEKMSKHPQKEGLSLELIQGLGGTKEDLRLIGDVEDDDSVEDLDLVINEFETEPIKKDEIRSFMDGLGIYDHRPDTGKEDRKPKKLLSAPVDNEDSDEEKASTSKATTPTTDLNQAGDKKKKKEKNKFKKEDASTESSPKHSKEEEKKIVKGKETAAEGEKKTVKGKETAAESSETKTKKDRKNKKEKNKFKVQHAEISSTTACGVEELTGHLKTRPQRPSLLVKPGDVWLDDHTSEGAEDITRDLVHQCQQFAAKLLEDEVALYKRQREKTKRGESNWMKTVLTSGTLSDKMAALTLLVQESPAHNMTALDSLVNMTKKKGKREAMLASDTMKNLIISESSPLPDDRKLIPFNARPFSTLWHTCSGNKDNVDRRLVVWYAEDLLRQKYSAFVKALDVMSYDTLTATKEKALAVIHSLMVSKPEQEEVLLPMLVNKLGDPNHTIASKASYLLIKLVEQHPNMKTIIAGEVERLVYRPNVSQRAQYYAMCFLNQIKLHGGDHALASRLIGIFFAFFKTYVSSGEVDSKMMAALLTGVNRAYPYAKLKRDFLEEQMTTLYKIVHIVNFNTSVQALMLLHQVVDPSASDSDRYFMALYRKLLDPALRTSAKQAQFLNLIYKSMKADIIEKRVKALMKRLLQAGALLGPNFLCGALIVVSEILKERPSLLAVKQLGKSTTARDAHENILNKAAGKETERPRPAFLDDDDDDEEERFVDLPLPPEFQDEVDNDENQKKTQESKSNEKKNEEKGEKSKSAQGVSSWVHRQNLTGKFEQQSYDALQRNPLHCHAQNECLWELKALARHYHPSVALFARTILQGEPVVYTGDPLQDFTLIRFLDRFVYKNPKKKEAGEGKSETVGAASGKRQKGESVPVNSAEFIEGGEESVPEHERYLYRYFSQRAEKKKKAEDEASEAGSVSDNEFDSYLDSYERQMDFDDLDDMDFGTDLAGKNGSGGLGDLDDSSDEDMEENEEDTKDLSDEEIDFGDDDDDELAAEFRREMAALEEMGSDGEEEDDEDDDFSGDELKQMMSGSGSKKRKMDEDDDFDMPMEKKAKSKRSRGIESMFAAADDFADLLEENADVGSTALGTLGTLDDVSNPDKASAKQIAWEANRDRQTRGKDWQRNKGRGRPGPRGGKPFKKGNNRGSATRKNYGGKGRK